LIYERQRLKAAANGLEEIPAELGRHFQGQEAEIDFAPWA
jgi:hypothetical protein